MSEISTDLRIVHIVPHLGGGVGAVIINFVQKTTELNVSNQVFSLDWCDEYIADRLVRERTVQGSFWHFKKSLVDAITDCDVVLIHYWNHPLMTVFLAETEIPKYKTAFWCHNSGLSEPHIIPTYLANIVSTIIFTSAASVKAPNFQKLSGQTKNGIFTVPSVRDLSEFFEVGSGRTNRLPQRKLLYVGTVSKAKLHPDTPFIFSELSQRGFEINVVGGPDHEELAAEVKSLGGVINIHGHVKRVLPFYEDADVFVYPLRSDHYGTGEQVILEALSSGLPVVAFANPAESIILKEFHLDRLVRSKSAFIATVLTLINSGKDLIELKKQIYSKAKSLFRSYETADHLLAILRQIGEASQDLVTLDSSKLSEDGIIALFARASFFDEQVFFRVQESQEKGVELLTSLIYDRFLSREHVSKWQARAKSTPAHYLRYFPDDRNLIRLVANIKKFSKF